MFCSRCGKETSSDSIFCDECRNNLSPSSVRNSESSGPNGFMGATEFKKSQLEINYEKFKSDVNVAFIVSIVSLALIFFGFSLLSLIAAIFCLIKCKKISHDIDQYENMNDYGSCLSKSKASKIMSIISLALSIVGIIVSIIAIVFAFLSLGASFFLTFLPFLAMFMEVSEETSYYTTYILTSLL